jgi:hypothetical protein
VDNDVYGWIGRGTGKAKIPLRILMQHQLAQNGRSREEIFGTAGTAPEEFTGVAKSLMIFLSLWRYPWPSSLERSTRLTACMTLV